MPFVIYADFESLLVPHSTCQPSPSTSSTTTIQSHIPCSYGYYIKCTYDNSLSQFKFYRGENSAKQFVESICNDAERLFREHIDNCRAMDNLTASQKREFNKKDAVCHICKKIILETKNKARDHCHFTGKYRGPAHSDCNLAYQIPKCIPVFFHNLSGYDAHLFFKELGADKKNITAIAKNKENYISYSKKIEWENLIDGKKKSGKLRFVDSFKFMASSLDSLAQGLNPDDFKELKSQFTDCQLLLQKGVYPYEYIDSFNKFQENSLPPIGAFFSKMSNSNITNAQYEHARKVWQKYGIQNLGQYSDLYLKTDVMLLTDIFENFRKECFVTYGLDPAQYVTAPSLSWDAMLKYTEVELDLLTEIDMLHFLRKGIRGGITQCSHRISNANNHYMLEKYDKKKKKFLISI
jgi:Recombination endonuclease VII